ncbi:hypothetical protein [Streptomyces aidingensis]|uniref:DUF2637 domain-containing protein n=1 Tax=Streptomyces aidingensis TaxID=910347 RepID=A0A1I1TU55_9ACTN|nr:hypothetical protein [Streptomyces aidingensis]SFD61925.1 hypothetical protein SAMN05421773_12128 [Streptomyces aidingensis]
MKRDVLGWAALGAAIVVTASAEYQLARACGFGTVVAAGVPAALDIYAIRALRAHRDVFAVVLAMIAVNAAAHLVAAGLLPVTWHLVTAVSAIAPLVLWRVHALREVPAGTADHPVPELLEPAPVPLVPPGARLLPIVAPAEAPAVTLERERVPVLGEFTPLPELLQGFGGTIPDQAVSPSAVPAGTAPEPVGVPAEPLGGNTGTSSGPGAADIESEPSENTRLRAHVERARNWLEREPELTGTAIGARLGASDSYGRRIKRAALAGR